MVGLGVRLAVIHVFGYIDARTVRTHTVRVAQCAYASVCVRVCVCLFMCECICARVYERMCMLMRMCASVHVSVYVLMRMRVSIHVYKCSCACVYMRVLMCVSNVVRYLYSNRYD